MTEDNAVPPGVEDPPQPRVRSLGRNTLVMASGTLVSRGLGFIRNAMLVAAIGVTGIAANSYDVANKIPNTLYAIVAAGVLNAVLVPQIVRAFRRPDGKRTVDRIVTLGVFGSLGITLLFTLAAPIFVNVYTQGWDAPQRDLAIAFAFWCIPQLFFYSTYTILGQVLNAREQFGPYMWAPVLNNVVSIVGLAAFLAMYGGYSPQIDDPGWWTVLPTWLIAGTATLGIAAQALVLIWPLARGGYRWSPVWRGPKGELSGVTTVAGWALGAVLLDQVGVIVATRIASEAGAVGSDLGDAAIAGNAAYFNAMMLYLLPHSLIIVSLITALATTMSRHAAAKDTESLRLTVVRGMRIVTVFGLWSTAVLFALAPAIVRIALPTVPTDEAMSVAYVLMALSLGSVPLALLGVFKNVFFALEDAKAVFSIQIPVTIAWVGGMLALQQALDPYWWTAGVGLALSLSNIAGVAMRGIGVRNRVGTLELGAYAWLAGRSLLAAGLAGGVGWSLLRFIPETDLDDRMQALGVAIGALAVLIPLMGLLYWAVLRVLRVPEASELAAPLTRRLRRNVR
ncbi:murein biosynthesis integral membrane protein MurJ [Demequina rhizosphaerae]|uniref:murein biosynthesis integral membrane protein MurJ n=1 Tax=Demequina rhizosphaerae TaxID=1638985 RepID=UPI000782E652|nr:murein biosynthesis integral membrane protein MurJ [Demequina rhizosphaerae]